MEEFNNIVYSVETVNGRNRVTEIRFSGYLDNQGQFKMTRCVGKIFTDAVKSYQSERSTA